MGSFTFCSSFVEVLVDAVSFLLGTEAESSGKLVVDNVLSEKIFCTYARVVEPQEMRRRGEPPDRSCLDGAGRNRKTRIGTKSSQENEWKGLEWELAVRDKIHEERMQKWKEERDNRRRTEEEQWRKYWMQKERIDGMLEAIRLAIGRGNYWSETNKVKMNNGKHTTERAVRELMQTKECSSRVIQRERRAAEFETVEVKEYRCDKRLRQGTGELEYDPKEAEYQREKIETTTKLSEAFRMVSDKEGDHKMMASRTKNDGTASRDRESVMVRVTQEKANGKWMRGLAGKIGEEASGRVDGGCRVGDGGRLRKSNWNGNKNGDGVRKKKEAGRDQDKEEQSDIEWRINAMVIEKAIGRCRNEETGDEHGRLDADATVEQGGAVLTPFTWNRMNSGYVGNKSNEERQRDDNFVGQSVWQYLWTGYNDGQWTIGLFILVYADVINVVNSIL